FGFRIGPAHQAPPCDRMGKRSAAPAWHTAVIGGSGRTSGHAHITIALPDTFIPARPAALCAIASPPRGAGIYIAGRLRRAAGSAATAGDCLVRGTRRFPLYRLGVA